jgi:hypothetical protein
LRDKDLERAKWVLHYNILLYVVFIIDFDRVNQAEAVFILSARGVTDKSLADQHTILRSWAIKDFAPDTRQFLQIFHPENKIHVKHAGLIL